MIENNIVNGKPIYYYRDTSGIKIPKDAGEVILTNCSNMIVKNIDASGGTVGIEVAYTKDSLITNNNANSNSCKGIYLYSSSNNILTKNNLNLNDYYGIYLLDSSTNKIYLNNFVDNTIQAYDNTGTNSWDNGYPSGGNYWSDYDEESEGAIDVKSGPNQDQAGSDGFADTPYDILGSAGAKDNYPLMEPKVEKPRIITFSGYQWVVKDSGNAKTGPGQNYFSDSEENVWVDEQGRLHLRITKGDDGKWYCAEVYTTEPLGYGEYVFYVTGRIDQMDKNVVLGLFNYLDDEHEIDIEICNGWMLYGGNVLFAVKPDILFGPDRSVDRFNMNLDNSPESGKGKSTHKFVWNRNSIFFKSIYGHHYTQPENSYIIHNWCYTGENIPEPMGLKPHINLWLDKGNQPTDNEEIEIIIDRFEFRGKKKSWLENPQFIGCVHDTGIKKKVKNTFAFEKCTSEKGCWGARGYTWAKKEEELSRIDESQFNFSKEDNDDYNVYIYGKDDQNLDDPHRKGGEGYAAVTVIQGNVWRGPQPKWNIPDAISIDDKELYIDIWLKKGKSSSHLDKSSDSDDQRDRVMYAIDVWLMEGDDPNSTTAKRMVLDLIFHLGSGDTPWINYTQPTSTKGWIFHYQPVISSRLEEGEWEFFSFDLSKYIDDAIKAANKHKIAKKYNIKYQKENLKLYQAEMLIELRHADAELTIGGFDLYYYPTSSKEMVITAFCPVDLSIIDPEGLTITKQLNEIPSASYIESDVNGDGDPDDIISIPDRKIGNYQIIVIPESDAEPTDRYTLKVSIGDTTTVLAENVSVSEIPEEPYVFESKAPFDTGSPYNPYPSISGTHTGTITPGENITVHRLYTYPCEGTGGHTEYVRIYGNGIDKNASWNGYNGDWQYIYFDNPFVLEEGKTYNYTIMTGSYPQIIHETPFNATGGTITCTRFIDANGRTYTDWIPAIRLE
mgnify:CR=1 FL=1